MATPTYILTSASLRHVTVKRFTNTHLPPEIVVTTEDVNNVVNLEQQCWTTILRSWDPVVCTEHLGQTYHITARPTTSQPDTAALPVITVQV